MTEGKGGGEFLPSLRIEKPQLLLLPHGQKVGCSHSIAAPQDLSLTNLILIFKCQVLALNYIHPIHKPRKYQVND